MFAPWLHAVSVCASVVGAGPVNWWLMRAGIEEKMQARGSLQQAAATR